MTSPDVPNAPDGLLSLRVIQVRLAAEDVLSYTLAAADAAPLPDWTPGAHIDVVLPSGLVRNYSLCGPPGERHLYRIAVLLERNGRGGSRELHETQLVGQTLRATHPKNHFELQPAPRYVFVAGGIGITPILPMLRAASERGVPWELVYGARSRSAMAFLDEIAAVPGGQVTLVPEETDGRLDLPGTLGRAGADAHVYCCGPAGLVDGVLDLCDERLAERVHVERFAARDQPAGALAPSPKARGSFEVELATTGVVLAVADGETILDAVRRSNTTVLSSCEEGYCGTCETKVLDGVPDHRDTVLSDAERASSATMMICVSRSKSARLVLDL